MKYEPSCHCHLEAPALRRDGRQLRVRPVRQVHGGFQRYAKAAGQQVPLLEVISAIRVEWVKVHPQMSEIKRPESPGLRVSMRPLIYRHPQAQRGKLSGRLLPQRDPDYR